MIFKTRFAPSPTGLLHLGNIYSALQCERWAKEHDAALLLRIEDIDFTRCKPEFKQQMMDDLAWMGLSFDGEMIHQSQRLETYNKALHKLIDMGVLYPCFCTRKEIQTNTMHTHALDNYPKTCRYLNAEEVLERKQYTAYAWRLHSQKVTTILANHDLYWLDGDEKKQWFNLNDIGDVVIGRKDIQLSYHLAVVVDDAAQHITHVIRGRDLRDSTPVHRVLQLLLGYSSPLYIHHDLLLDTQGTRLAKSKGSTTIKSLRDEGISADDVRNLIKKVSIS